MASSEQHAPSLAAGVQVRRAWLVLGFASLICFTLIVGAITGARWVYRHATEPETARLNLVSGNGALVRSPGDVDWRLVSGDVRIHEGDRVSTALGTVITLELFDGSTVEVTEDTIVHVARMRSSRFLKRTKLIVLEAERGTIYVGMAPRGDYDFSEITTRVGDLRVTMSDEEGRAEAGAYLVEVLEVPSGVAPAEHPVRAAVLHGAATVRRADQSAQLGSNQQVRIDAGGAIGEITTIVRELIVNGDFSHALSGWVEFEEDTQRHSGAAGGMLVELAQDHTTLGDAVVVELARTSDRGDSAQVGIRQRIGKTLRVHTSLLLSFEVRIVSQEPVAAADPATEFPLVVQLNYVDMSDHEQVWSHGYYVNEESDAQRHIPLDVATRIDHDRWQRIFFDLRGLSPLPKQITSIVVYASGQNYQTRVANVSLTTSELTAPVP